ncbi:MAG TPA: ATP-grasp domain-containing protein [Candidatus Dormibacteraeota bacterium]
MTETRSKAVFLGPDPLPAIASGLPVLCADGAGIAPGGQPAWEAFPGTGARSTSALLLDPKLQRRLQGGFGAAVVWKSSAGAEAVARDLGVLLANSPARIARRIENKSQFSRIAEEAGLPTPPTKTGLATMELLRSAGELRFPLVFQLARGFSGEHTYPVPDRAQLERLVEQFRGRPCRVAERIAGTPVTVTGVVSRERLLVGQAGIQLTGIPSLTPHPLGSCGNDYHRPPPGADQIRRLALRAAEWLRGAGHLGIFGLDLVAGTDGNLRCIEINPRLVASVPLFSLSARDELVPGILEQHLASFGLAPGSDQGLDSYWSQLILYQRGQRRAEPGVASSRGQRAASGRYLATSELPLSGPLPGESALLVQGQSRPGRELARFIFEGPVLGPDGGLLPEMEGLVDEIRAQLETADRPGRVS